MIKDTNYLDDQKKGYYVFLSLLYMSVLIYSLISQPVNIMINPTAISREDVGDFFDLFFLRPILFLFLVIFPTNLLRIHKISKTAFFTTIIITLFVASIKVSSFFNGYQIPLYMLYSKVAFCFIGISLFAIAIRYPLFLNKVNVLVYIVSLFAVSLFWFFANMQGWFIYDLHIDTLNITLDRLASPLIVSTEFSNIIFLVLLLGLILRANTRVGKILPLAIILLSGNIFLGYLTIYQFSTGTYLAACFIYFLDASDSRKKLIYLFIGVVTFSIGLLALNNLYEFMHEYWILKSDDPTRFFTYSYLFDSALHSPWFGCGYGFTFDHIKLYPHQNILGIWSELGLLPALIYIGLFITNICALILYNFKKPFTSGTIHFVLLASLFLHLKGFVHDTWQNGIIYISFGLQVSLILYINSKKYLGQETKPPM